MIKHIDIRIKSISHKSQRYETVGDYFTDKKGKEQIRVSRMSDPRYELLVAVHEFRGGFSLSASRYKGVRYYSIR